MTKTLSILALVNFLAACGDGGNSKSSTQLLEPEPKNFTVSGTITVAANIINDSDIIIDGIHPTTSGSLKQADLIWPVLQPLL